MRILILGGTVFVGHALTGAALAAGHAVTHLNRGRSAPDDPRVETRHADRADPAALAAALGGDRWDAVVDTCGYLPQVVARSTAALADRTGLYAFVSSISAYAAFPAGGFDEEAALASPPEPLPDAWTGETYGGLKAGCEAVVRRDFGPRALVVRPGLIVGPHDPTDRFTYWPARIARGGAVLAPGRPARPVQFIDVRDLAAWMVDLLGRGVAGTFNATGPRQPLAMGAMLEAMRTALGGEATLEWVDDAYLVAQGVAPWRELPLWIPESDPSMAGLMGTSIARAVSQGLSFRPLAETARDTLDWHRSRGEPPLKAGLAPEREAALLASLRA